MHDGGYGGVSQQRLRSGLGNFRMPRRQRHPSGFGADARIFVFPQRLEPLPRVFGMAFAFGQFCSGAGEVRIVWVIHQGLVESRSCVFEASLVQLGRTQSGFGQGLAWHAVLPSRAGTFGGDKIAPSHGHHGFGLQDIGRIRVPFAELLQFQGGFAESPTLHETKGSHHIGGSHGESVRETKKRDAEASRKILGCSGDQPPKV